MKTLTRSELYDLVWSKPLSKLAPELGVSDVGLAKLCKRHNVPTPARGYWAKLEAGHAVTRALLPDVVARDESIGITPTLSGIPGEAHEEIANAKAQPRADLPLAHNAPEEDLHRSVRKTARRLRAAKPSKTGLVDAAVGGCCGIETTPDQVERVITSSVRASASSNSNGSVKIATFQVRKSLQSKNAVLTRSKERSRGTPTSFGSSPIPSTTTRGPVSSSSRSRDPVTAFDALGQM
jgi:hypothetical protein